MKTPLAPLNLAHNKLRTLVATAGVTFAIALLFMQIGFFVSILTTSVGLYEGLDFDLVVVSPNYVSITQAGSFPRARLYQLRGLPEVVGATPLYVGRVMWRNPTERNRRSVVVLGFNPADEPFRSTEINQQRSLLARPGTVLVDRDSRPELGPLDVGVTTELNTRRMEIGGHFSLGPGLEAGLAIVGDQNFSRLYYGYPLDRVNLGLVKLREGTNRVAVRDKLNRLLAQGDARVLTRADIERKQKIHWIVSTSTGVIFGSGVLVALAFGMVITYQVLSVEIASRLDEYATLKAMGYTDGYLALVVLQQGLILGVLGYAPAYGIALLIYTVTFHWTKLPVSMTWPRAVGVLVASLAMCSLSAVMSVRIVRTADPADVF